MARRRHHALPRREEHLLGGRLRVPTLIRWPGVIEPGTVVNEIGSHEDMLPTILAAAGDPNVKQKLLTGLKAGARTYKVHLDGYDLGPALAAKAESWPRDEMLYWSDDGEMMALRFKKWKAVFAQQTADGFEVWRRPLEKLRLPLILNLRTDPFERRRSTRSTTTTGCFAAPTCSCRRRPTSPAGSRA